MKVEFSSVLQLQKAIMTKQISSVELVTETLAMQEKLQPVINAFVTTTPELALQAAHLADNSLAKGEILGPLHGLPISVKDNISVQDVRFTNGSLTMKNNMGVLDALAVERIKQSGAAIIGKTTTTEFAIKASVGYSPISGVTKNPWNLNYISGGSSSGAAASVAAGITPFALGTDGGGSIRIPASLCGVFGIKPQFGRVPIYPVAATPTLAHHSPMARTVRDAACLLNVIAGYDSRDIFSVATDKPDFLAACELPVQGMRIAWSPTLGYGKPDLEIVKAIETSLTEFEQLGCSVDLVEDIFVEDPLEIWNNEFYAGAGTKLKILLEGQKDVIDPDVRSILSGALSMPLEKYYNSVFARNDVYQRLNKFFDSYDLIISPTLPVAAFEDTNLIPPTHQDKNMVSWVTYTYPFNLTGNPAASVPCGFTSKGLPIGMQMVAGRNKEVDIFRAAAAFEAAKPWTAFKPTFSFK